MTRLRCAILDDYQDVALRFGDWSGLADRIETRVFRDHFEAVEDLVAAIGDCEIVVAMRERTRFPAEVLARLPNLRLLITTGMRNASIDVAAANARGVAVCGTRGAGDPTTEHAWALILGLARHLVTEAAALRAGGPWQSTVGVDLQGKTLGLIGLGRLGGRVARVGQAFGMETVAWSQNLTPERTDELGVRLAPSLDDLMAASDIASIHLVLSRRTRGLIGARELARMKPSALLVNTSRGPIVDEAALVAALRAGTIAGAAVDVFETEPLPADHPMRTAPNLLATPHLGYVTAENYAVFFRDAVEDVAAFLAGAPVRRLEA
jgi:phosphoglycerate dehydrogenase-like enzyme